VSYKVFIDTSLLIAAVCGEEPLRQCALAVLNEPNIEFWYSPMLRLEATLQPAHHKKVLELAFMEEYFNGASCMGNLNNIYAKCKVLVTAGKTTKPMFRTELVKVVTILSLVDARQDRIKLFLDSN